MIHTHIFFLERLHIVNIKNLYVSNVSEISIKTLIMFDYFNLNDMIEL